MKRIIFVVLAIMCYCLPVVANEQEVIESFKHFSNQVLAPIRDSYARNDAVVLYNPNKGFYTNKGKPYWEKFGNDGLVSSIDIQRTNSIVSPYVGMIMISHANVHYVSSDNQSGYFATKADAARATIRKIDNMAYYFKYKYFYAYQDGSWVFLKEQGVTTDPVRNTVSCYDTREQYSPEKRHIVTRLWENKEIKTF